MLEIDEKKVKKALEENHTTSERQNAITDIVLEAILAKEKSGQIGSLVKPANGVRERLENIIDIKEGNKEMALFYYGGDNWALMIGNTSDCVSIGEASGDFEVEGENIDDVITQMEMILNGSRINQQGGKEQ